jgi:hypothetical protein
MKILSGSKIIAALTIFLFIQRNLSFSSGDPPPPPGT